MAWTKDTTTQSPKVLYTPGNDAPEGVTLLVYDPDAEQGERYTATFSFILSPFESLDDIDNALGII